jgi:hypothetical protein
MSRGSTDIAPLTVEAPEPENVTKVALRELKRARSQFQNSYDDLLHRIKTLMEDEYPGTC